MRTSHKLLSTLVLLALFLLPAQSVFAKGLLDGQVIFGGNYTLKSGDTLNGDLVVFGGNAVIEESAIVNGSVVIFGGNITVNGDINGDLVLIGGLASLGDKAVISGDLATVGGSVQRAPGARVKGETLNNVPVPSIQIPPRPSVPNQPSLDVNFNPLARIIGVFFRAIAVAALAMLLMLFLEPQLGRVAQAIATQPLITGGVGLLTVIVFPIAVLLLAITIILIPVALLAIILLVLAWLFGMIAIGMEIGLRFTKMINQTWAPVLATGFGTLLVMLVVDGIGMVPCIGWLAAFLVGVIGIGAVLLTMFGTRPYLPAINAVSPAPPADKDPVG